jgi:hypothetical protein
MKLALRVLSLALLVCFAFVTAHAAVLVAPISGQFPDVFTDYCASGCTQVAYVSTGPEADSAGTFTATLNAAVYEDPSNTFCADCLDFVYQVINSGSSAVGIGRVTAFNFTGWSVDAGFAPAASTISGAGGTAFADGTDAPGLVDRNTPDTIGFQFESSPTAAIAPGDTSNLLVIETNSTIYGAGAAAAIDGGTADFAAFDPSPEPTSALLMGFGMLALAGVRRFRRR